MEHPAQPRYDLSPLAAAWPLDPQVTFLNHGSFGACPRAVLDVQHDLRRQMELEPVRFLVRELPPRLDASRRALAELVGAEAEDLVFVRNATMGANSVLRSLRFAPGDEILVTDHGYNACRCAAELAAARSEARVVVAAVPAPIDHPQQVVDAILAHLTDRTRLALIDHVTSPTAIVFPIREIVAELAGRGVDTLVDGAHAPGMVPLDLRQIGAAYYTGNGHKWLCAPKGAAFLHVRRDRQPGLHPPVVSHGYNTPRSGYSRFQDEFDWTGTDDPTPWLCVEHAIRFLGGLLDGGLPALMDRNHRLALCGRRMLCDSLGLRPVCPDSMLGSMAALWLPDEAGPIEMDTASAPTPLHPVQTALLMRFGIEVPVYHWPTPPRRLVRISAHAYNSAGQYQRLIDALRTTTAEDATAGPVTHV
jgi:isopenicillin-N epimerase